MSKSSRPGCMPIGIAVVVFLGLSQVGAGFALGVTVTALLVWFCRHELADRVQQSAGTRPEAAAANQPRLTIGDAVRFAALEELFGECAPPRFEVLTVLALNVIQTLGAPGNRVVVDPSDVRRIVELTSSPQFADDVVAVFAHFACIDLTPGFATRGHVHALLENPDDKAAPRVSILFNREEGAGELAFFVDRLSLVRD